MERKEVIRSSIYETFHISLRNANGKTYGLPIVIIAIALVEGVWIKFISHETLLDDKNKYGDSFKASKRFFLLVRSQGWAPTTDSTKQK